MVRYENVKKGVRDIMGGQVLEYEAKTIFNEGRLEGISEGRCEGRLEGRREGILAGKIEQAVVSYKDIGMEKDKIVAYLMDKFSLTLTEANGYYEMYGA